MIKSLKQHNEFLQAATRGVLQKNVFLEFSQNSQDNTCVGVSEPPVSQACNFIKKETLAHGLSCEFCEVFKNTFLQNTSGRLLLNFTVRIFNGLFNNF